MSVSCQKVISIIENYAPKYMAEDWDNIGLQMGSPAMQVDRVFITLDLNMEVLDEAINAGAQMIVVHHTPLFKPLKNIRTDYPQGRLVEKIVQQGLALYTAHTNLDSTYGGVNEVLAQKIGLKEIDNLATSWQEKLYKLVVYVPKDYSEMLRESMADEGAGCIGNYSDCSFSFEGIGTFRPLDGTNPFIGQKGQLERVEEVRLETIVPEVILNKVIKAMLKAHPYEEVAYDVIPLANKGRSTGLGRVGKLQEPITLAQFIDLVKNALNIEKIRYCGDLNSVVTKAAVCGGSGISLLPQVIFSGAEVFLTADIKYHEAQDVLAQGISCIDAGHFATEQPIIPVMAEYLQNELIKDNIEVIQSKINTNPFRFL